MKLSKILFSLLFSYLIISSYTIEGRSKRKLTRSKYSRNQSHHETNLSKSTKIQLRKNFIKSMFNWITSKITNAFTSFKNLFAPLPLENLTYKDKFIGIILLLLEVIKSLKIPKISDYAQNILKFSDIIEKCLNIQDIPKEFEEIINMLNGSNKDNGLSEEDKQTALENQLVILKLFDTDLLYKNYMSNFSKYNPFGSDYNHSQQCTLAKTALENPSKFFNILQDIYLLEKKKKFKYYLGSILERIKYENIFNFGSYINIREKFIVNLFNKSQQRNKDKLFDNNSPANWCIKGNIEIINRSFFKDSDEKIFCIEDFITEYRNFILEFDKFCKNIQSQLFKSYKNILISFNCDKQNRFNKDDSINTFIEIYKLLGPINFENSQEELKLASEKYIQENKHKFGDEYIDLNKKFNLINKISDKLKDFNFFIGDTEAVIYDYIKIKINALNMSMDCEIFENKSSYLDKVFYFLQFIKKLFSFITHILGYISRCMKPVGIYLKDALKDNDQNTIPNSKLLESNIHFNKFFMETYGKHLINIHEKTRELYTNNKSFEELNSKMADVISDQIDIKDKVKSDIQAETEKNKNKHGNDNGNQILENLKEKPESQLKDEEINKKKEEIIKSVNKGTFISKFKEFIKFVKSPSDSPQMNELEKDFKSHVEEASNFLEHFGGDQFSNDASFLTAEKKEEMQGQVNELKKDIMIKIDKKIEKTKDLINNKLTNENYNENIGKYFANEFDGFHDDYVIQKAFEDEKIMEKVNKKFKERMKNELDDFKKKPFDYSLKVASSVASCYIKPPLCAIRAGYYFAKGFIIDEINTQTDNQIKKFMQMQFLQKFSPETKLIITHSLKKVRDIAVTKLDDLVSGKIPAIDIANQALKGKEFILGLKKISESSKVKNFEKINNEVKNLISEYKEDKDKLTKVDPELSTKIQKVMENYAISDINTQETSTNSEIPSKTENLNNQQTNPNPEISSKQNNSNNEKIISNHELLNKKEDPDDQQLIPNPEVLSEMNQLYINLIAQETIIEEVKNNKHSLINNVKNFFKKIGTSLNFINDTYDSSISLAEDLKEVMPDFKEIIDNKLKDAKDMIIKFIGLGPFNAIYYGKKVLDIVRYIYKAFNDQSLKERLRSWGRLIGIGIEFFTEKPIETLKNIYNSIFHSSKNKRKKLKRIKKRIY